MTPEEQFDGAISLVWLCQKAGIQLEAEGDGPDAMIVMRVDDPSGTAKFPDEIRALMKPYKSALLEMMRSVRHDLQKQVYRDINEALGAPPEERQV